MQQILKYFPYIRMMIVYYLSLLTDQLIQLLYKEVKIWLNVLTLWSIMLILQRQSNFKR
jgi:hypothetical protein